MLYLGLGIVAFLLGPLLYLALGRRTRLRNVLDLAVTGLVTVLALLILWESLDEGGLLVVAFGLIGFAGPLIAERMLAHREHGVHVATLVVGVAGLALHAAVDGAALLFGDAGRGETAALAVIAHRVPAGLAVWWLAQVGFGRRIAWAVLAAMVIATLIGYEAASITLDLVSNEIFSWFQSFVAGSLLHLAFHRVRFGEHDHPHGHQHDHHQN
ncbi:MAG: hypothetical protein O2910_04930 [Proteobacteria bacterium]|nr:hypothetical protein [Pseudomonadota bacterium]